MVRRHGLGRAGYDALLTSQRHRCAICRTPFRDEAGRRPAVDHDHRHCPGEQGCPECVRGALDNACNNLLRLAKDDPAILRRAARYLVKGGNTDSESP